ncbi:MAG: DUF2911 domain-containing protein [Cyclobacteriaceae bacterium]
MKYVIIVLILIAVEGLGQEIYPPLSHKGSIEQMVGNIQFEIVYERPSARGREIFGGLVPYGQPWRTGASYCTTVSFDGPVTIANKMIPAGEYALVTVPDEEEWSIRLNLDHEMYGTYDYDSTEDVVSFTVPVRKSNRYYETVTIDLDVIPNNLMVYISWTNVQVAFEIETGIDAEVMDHIKNSVDVAEQSDPQELAMAADYLYFQNQELEMALQLANRSLTLDPDGWSRNVILLLHQRMGNDELALDFAQASLKYKRKQQDSEEIERWLEIVDQLKQRE